MANALHRQLSLLVYPKVQFFDHCYFLIYINYISTNLSCKTTLYADDTSIPKHVTNPITLITNCDMIQRKLKVGLIIGK